MFIRSLGTLITAVGLAALGGCAADTLPPVPGSASASPSSFSNVEYACNSGASVRVSYLNDEVALVSYQGKTHSMDIKPVASGTRYVGEGLEWRTKGTGKGSSAMLLKHQPGANSGQGGQQLENCAQLSS